MSVHLRVDLPDRPGVLARLADALARAGADVLSVAVSERSPGRATDDFLLEWPAPRSPDALTAAVESVAGCQVLGLRRVATVPDENPALDLVTHVLWQPHRALETLVDMLPAFAGADWAVLLDRDEVRCLYGTPGTPAALPDRGSTSPTRATAFAHVGGTGVTVPVGDTGLAIVVGRHEAPPFSRREIDELIRLCDLTIALTRVVLPQGSTPPSRLTAALVSVAVRG
jgi:hypothetical protein